MTSNNNYGKQMGRVDFDERSPFRVNPWDTRKPCRNSRRDSPFIPGTSHDDSTPRRIRDSWLSEELSARSIEETSFHGDRFLRGRSKIKPPDDYLEKALDTELKINESSINPWKRRTRRRSKRQQRWATYSYENDSSPHCSRTPNFSPQRYPQRDRFANKLDYREKECNLSDLITDSHLTNIEASKKSMSFRKWFKTLPPNVKVDKDVFTKRGMLITKDNFRNSGDLDSYLGIEKSRSPSQRRRW